MSDLNEILIFSQTRNKRILVGKLWRESTKYHFEYDAAYKKKKNALPLGPEFALWKSKFTATKLFPSIADRIPSKQNPAYADYCQQWNIDKNEKDVFVLLTTIGRRGPSTFLFEPSLQNAYGGEQIKAFRNKLELTQAEFENLVGISHTTLVKLETGQIKNTLHLSLLQIIDQIPEALRWLIMHRGHYLHDEKRLQLLT